MRRAFAVWAVNLHGAWLRRTVFCATAVSQADAQNASRRPGAVVKALLPHRTPLHTGHQLRRVCGFMMQSRV